MSVTRSVANARTRAGLTITEVAARSGVGLTNLSAIENGRRVPRIETLERLAAAVGISGFVPITLRGRYPAAHWAEQIVHAERIGNHSLAYRSFIQLADDLAAADAVNRVLLSAEPPAPSESRWIDAVAAIVEQRLDEVSAPIPTWVLETSGQPGTVWDPRRFNTPVPISGDIAEASPPFQRRGVSIEANELESA